MSDQQTQPASQAPAIPPRRRTPAEIGKDRFRTMHDLLEQSKLQMQRVLPNHMSADRLVRIALTQCRINPTLLECTPESMLGALMKASQLGLEPDGVTGRAYLIPRRNRRLGTMEVNFQRGYKGILDLCYRSGQIASVRADVVREGDFLLFEKGLEEKLVHRPAKDNWDAAITHVYAVIKLKEGGSLWDIWPSERVEAHRHRFSKDTREDSVWNTDWEAMAKKTVLIAVGNLAPMAVEWQRAVALEREDGNAPEADELPIGASIVDGIVTEGGTNGDAPKGPAEQQAERLKGAVKRSKKTESGAAPATTEPAGDASPQAPATDVHQAPGGGGAAPAPSPAPEEEAESDEPLWRVSDDPKVVFLDIVRNGVLGPEALTPILRHCGATRGHQDQNFGLKGNAEALARLVRELKEGAEREMADRARRSST